MMKFQMTALMAAASVTAFVNTNAGKKLYIADTAQDNDLTEVEFAGLTWIQVKAVGNHGEIGSSTNLLNYDTWDTEVTQKAKGVTNAGDADIEVARDPDDPGQQELRAAANMNNNFAFKIEGNDAPAAAGSTPSMWYYRGLVTGPRYPMGRNEDFDLEVFTLGLNQKPILVDPVDGSV